jgi:predicted nuclease with TOPRIM domain
MSIKITKEEKEYLEKFIKDYQDIHKNFTEIELEVTSLQERQRELMINYNKLNEELDEIKKREKNFLKKMKEKYPGIKNLTELIDW